MAVLAYCFLQINQSLLQLIAYSSRSMHQFVATSHGLSCGANRSRPALSGQRCVLQESISRFADHTRKLRLLSEHCACVFFVPCHGNVIVHVYTNGLKRYQHVVLQHYVSGHAAWLLVWTRPCKALLAPFRGRIGLQQHLLRSSGAHVPFLYTFPCTPLVTRLYHFGPRCVCLNKFMCWVFRNDTDAWVCLAHLANASRGLVSSMERNSK
jgi:hypothetical protein